MTSTFADCDTHFVPSHSLTPHTVDAESNQIESAAGSEDGAIADDSNSPKSTSALKTNALFAMPKNEYAAARPYSFVSSP